MVAVGLDVPACAADVGDGEDAACGVERVDQTDLGSC